MNNKQRKRQRDIKTKLMAAICMLLVSSIMMVSTTYAWFTLSTAPEVTGITTAVGANGNLEMALLPENADLTKLDEQITSGEGDSMYSGATLVEDANITWGNLVDLNANSVYGLNQITLYPAALNTTMVNLANNEQAMGLAANILKTPAYGSDGRITELKQSTITGVYNGSAFEGESLYGVRAVGNSSNMTERQLAHRAALNAAANASTQAITTASTSLKNHGNTLANVAIRHATNEKDNGAGANYTQAEIETMLAAVTDLETAIGYIETAIKQYIVANSIADATDAGYTAIRDAILKDDTSIYTNISSVANVKIHDALTGADGYIKKLEATKGDVTNVKTNLEALVAGKENASFAWNDFSTYLALLVDAENMTINTKPVSGLTSITGYEKDADGNEDKSKPIYGNMEYLVDSVLDGDGLTLALSSGAGVFADIADFCGDYNAKISIEQIQYQGLKVKNVEAKMTTDTTVDPVYLTATRNATASFVGTTGAAASAPISDFYGYIIDLAFRTNAADSYLQLQSTAVDRVYEGNEANPTTMGGGSNMTFTPGTDFSTESAENLMEALRVVFFDPATKAILGYARLDKSTSTVTPEGGISMQLKMTKADGTKVMDKTDTSKEDPTIIALEANKATAVSVLVYLDGEDVTNADVANGNYSLMGSMNLQFSSSANLVPMDYTDLKTGSDTNTETQVTAVTPTIAGNATGVKSSRVAISGTTLGFSLTGIDESKHTVTATCNDGTELTLTKVADGVYTAEVPAGTTVTSVTITVMDSTVNETPAQPEVDPEGGEG